MKKVNATANTFIIPWVLFIIAFVLMWKVYFLYLSCTVYSFALSNARQLEFKNEQENYPYILKSEYLEKTNKQTNCEVNFTPTSRSNFSNIFD